MTGMSKRVKAWQDKISPVATYPIDEALALVKSNATAKFRESVDVAVNLGIDAKKSDQVVRGSALLPHGTGKVVRVAVFAQGQNAEKAKAAGADVVGFEDLAERMKDRLRHRHRDSRCHAHRRPARSRARSPWPDAEPQGGHGDSGRRDGGEECQGGPGALPRR
jgi:ribosomal protein L1